MKDQDPQPTLVGKHQPFTLSQPLATYFFYNSHLTNFLKKPEINRNVQERRKKGKTCTP